VSRIKKKHELAYLESKIGVSGACAGSENPRTHMPVPTTVSQSTKTGVKKEAYFVATEERASVSSLDLLGSPSARGGVRLREIANSRWRKLCQYLRCLFFFSTTGAASAILAALPLLSYQLRWC
jgi:hypothetical protein